MIQALIGLIIIVIIVLIVVLVYKKPKLHKSKKKDKEEKLNVLLIMEELGEVLYKKDNLYILINDKGVFVIDVVNVLNEHTLSVSVHAENNASKVASFLKDIPYIYPLVVSIKNNNTIENLNVIDINSLKEYLLKMPTVLSDNQISQIKNTLKENANKK